MNNNSQIDHIIINSKWKHSPQDVQAMRQADIGRGHNPFNVRLKLSRVKIGTKKGKLFDDAKESEG